MLESPDEIQALEWIRINRRYEIETRGVFSRNACYDIVTFLGPIGEGVVVRDVVGAKVEHAAP